MAGIKLVPQVAAPQIVSFSPKSSFLALLEYDQSNLRLTSWLKDGSVYQHTFVTPLDWEGLKQSQNHGSHWSKNISGKKLSVHIKSAKKPRSEIRKGRK